MRGFLKGLGELLFPVDVKCALCGGERGILAGSGICECCYGELPLEFMGEQVLGVSCFWALEYQDKAREMIGRDEALTIFTSPEKGEEK